MAHKTLINGTSYNTSGGKTLINGTAYNLKNGKTLVGGTVYGIEFGAKETGEIDLASLAPGVYQTGSNFSVLVKSWDALLADGDIRVNSAGEHYVYYYYDEDDCEVFTIPGGDLIISNTVTALAGWFSEWNNDITGVYIPDSVNSIGEGAFSCNFNIEFIHFGNNVTITEFPQFAFDSLWSLTSFNVPISVKIFGKDAMYDCEALSTIQYAGTKAQWNSITKASSWNSYCGEITVECSDGNIIVPATI